MGLIEQLFVSFLFVFLCGGFLFFFSAVYSSLSPSLPGWSKFKEGMLFAWIFTWPIFWIQMQFGPTFWDFFQQVFPFRSMSNILVIPLGIMIPSVLIVFPMWVLSYLFYLILMWEQRIYKIPTKLNMPVFFFIWAFLLPLCTAINGVYRLAALATERRLVPFTSKELASVGVLFLLCVFIPLIIASVALHRIVTNKKRKHIYYQALRELRHHGTHYHAGHTWKGPLMGTASKMRPLKGYFTYWK